MAETPLPGTLPKSDNLHRLEEFDLRCKLRQGYKVTDAAEMEALHSLASGAEVEAMAIDTEIARLRTLILGLEYSRDSLLKAASEAKSLIAPVRKLPPEILAEIFLLTYSSIRFSGTAGHGMPAAKVCYSWHHIAISTNKLWSCITITLEHGLPPLTLQRLQEVLELSGNTLLDLTLDNFADHELTLSEQMKSSEVFLVIHKHSQRCKYLTLQGLLSLVLQFFRIDASPQPFNSESGTLLPQLHSLYSLELDIEDNPDPEEVAQMVLRIPFTSAPKLRNVSILRTFTHHEGISFELPWRQLDTLMFGARRLSEFFNALLESITVTQACLYDCFFLCERDQSQLLPPISSDTLTSLRFESVNRETCTAMSVCFDKFTLPHLRELYIGRETVSYQHILDWPTDPFKGFVNRSGFPITMLTIFRVPMKDSTLIDILECLPRLEVLVAEETREKQWRAEQDRVLWLTNHLMERLQVRGPEPAGFGIVGNPVNRADASPSDPNCADLFLPYLREIDLKGKGSPDTFSFETFLEMIRTRRAAAMAHREGSRSILKTVELRIWDQPIDEAVRREIDTLRSCHEDLVLNVASVDM
jgi:hypothetical protein